MMAPGVGHGIAARTTAALVVLWCGLLGASPASARPPLEWSLPVLVDNGVPPSSVSMGLAAVACPSASLCVALDDLGNVVTTGAPAAVTGWTTTRLSKGFTPFLGISCPSVSLCVALGLSGPRGVRGAIAWTTDPAGGGASWHVAPAPIDRTGGPARFRVRPSRCAWGLTEWATCSAQPTRPAGFRRGTLRG
jgi:hypothetical protein